LGETSRLGEPGASPLAERFEPAAAHSVFSGGGEMGCLMRATDWSQTHLGSPESWSPALRMMAKFLLANRFPQLLWWGPEFCSLYNDAYIPILGTKHPWALGQPVSEVWKEIWHVLKPLIETPFLGGPATWMEDIPLEINRSGFFEETHFTIAYSPVPDETAPNGIGGVLATVHEITEKVVGERRVHALRDLGAHSAKPRSAEEAGAIVAQTLSSYPQDVPFLVLYLLDEKQHLARIACCLGAHPGDRACPPLLDLVSPTAEIWPLTAVLATRELHLVEGLKARFDHLPSGPWPDPPDAAAIVPVRSGIENQLAGFVIVGLSARMRFDENYRDFLELLSAQIGAMIANARAYEQERKRAEALAELDRAKTTFFSNVSHELRTPLTLVLGPTESALSSHARALAGSDLELVYRSELRLLKLVNTLLEFSRIEAGRVRAAYEPADVSALTAELASEFRSAMEQAGLRLVLDCEFLPEPVYVDREMWEKIVLNLVSNAFKSTFEGEIEVSVRACGDHVELTVRDTGTGIAAGEIPHLFERFHRIEGARRRTHEGTGIGLALVHELVKLHSGSIAIASQPGVGSAFTVSIPFGAAHLAQESISAPRELVSTAVGATPYVEEALSWLDRPNVPAPARETNAPAHLVSNIVLDSASAPSAISGRVLVVDDNRDMREYVRRLLSVHFEVMTAENGKAALAKIASDAPDLVLTDIMMPEMDGFELLAALRADEATSTIPVILISARAGEEATVEGLSAGADDYLVKPFTAHELGARVQTHLQMARRRRETEAALRNRAEQFETLLNQAPLGVFVVDADFRIRNINPTARAAFGHAVGLSCEECVGRDFAEFIHTAWTRDFADQVIAAFRSTLETGEPYESAHSDEFRLDRQTREHYEWRIDRITLPDGRYGVVCYFRDISANVEARKKLRLQEEMLRKTEKMAAAGQLAASLAHEINNPLSSVTNALYLLKISRLDGDASSLVDTASSELARVSRIVKQSLSYYRLGTVPREFDLSAIVEESIQIFDEKSRRANILLLRRVRPGLRVVGFPDEIRQVIDNLLLNAIEATSARGVISVYVHPSRKWGGRLTGVRLTIGDSGCGISGPNVYRVFEPFYTTKPEKGTGLGLWVVRGIVAKHDGQIHVRSTERAGRNGTVISIFWPAASESIVAAQAQSMSVA
jgi:PAS domain S-box-containing protein